MANMYDIDYSSSKKDFVGNEVDSIDGLFELNTFSESNYAYILDSQDYNIPAVTYDLLNHGVFTSASFGENHLQLKLLLELRILTMDLL